MNRIPAAVLGDPNAKLIGVAAAIGSFAQGSLGLVNQDALPALAMASAFVAAAIDMDEEAFVQRAREAYRLMLVVAKETDVAGTERSS